ncbi:hypothetical protein AB6A68_11010 [Ferrimicrobium acidiphilum]|uniref:HNH endonuclease n=2 Tax=Ferrimicrobium acidiphilum TaxID=121039 RepID=A0ABV3Y471_9ACTN
MREPRLGLAWSDRRRAMRRRYSLYMSSPEWFTRRQRWVEEWSDAHHGGTPHCLICGIEWTLSGDDLHHRTYTRLGHERTADLIALCRPCHRELHRRMEANPEWRRRPREQATDVLVAQMRHQRNWKQIS